MAFCFKEKQKKDNTEVNSEINLIELSYKISKTGNKITKISNIVTEAVSYLQRASYFVVPKNP